MPRRRVSGFEIQKVIKDHFFNITLFRPNFAFARSIIPRAPVPPSHHALIVRRPSSFIGGTSPQLICFHSTPPSRFAPPRPLQIMAKKVSRACALERIYEAAVAAVK